MSNELRRTIEQVALRIRHLRLWGALAICWTAWALVGLTLSALLARPFVATIPGGWLLASFAALAMATGAACATLALRSARDRCQVARRIESKYPDLGTGLLAAVEEDEASVAGRLGFLQSAVIWGALRHRRSHDWRETVPSRRLLAAKLAHAAALGFLLVVSFLMVDSAVSHDRDRRALAAGGSASGLHVEPGDTSVERGTSLLVVARFGEAVPADANLVVEGVPRSSARLKMTRSLEDPTFAGRVESVEADLAYRVEFEGRSSRSYRVSVFEYPEVLRTDAGLVFPEYTSLAPKTVEDVRHVTAVEGTDLTLSCRLNKAVAEARLVDEEGRSIALSPEKEGDRTYRATLKLTDPRRLRVQLIDREGRPNKHPAEIALNVARNRPAVVRMTQPSHDVRVSPLEELALKAELEDDFGVVRHGLSYATAGGGPRDLVLRDSVPKGRRVKAEHMLDFEALKAAPDQLVSYFFWAEDVGPDGRPRRSSGDMFFAEVRHFEEIFRQGEQPSGGSPQDQGEQGGNAREAMQLAELQKEIINGTWKLIRREIGSRPSDKFAEDSGVLRDSQQAAIKQAALLADRLQDATSKANLARAIGLMTDAEKHLTEAADSSRVAALNPALVAEQAAYQALLKLRDREFNVIRNNSRQRQGGGASAGGPSRRQLQQLELNDEENRYEEQRSARAQPEKLSRREQEQAEMRQVLSRLRELARRQADLNDRVKELQSALEAARDERAREEVERQLKRLRDQQQQVLRDTDELRERMEREENRDRMADARRQVEQGREHVRRASEALEGGRLSQALTEGARAGRQLDDLREELRKDASDRFSDEMTEMRDQARHLDETQDKLTERLDAWNRRPQHSLREDGERKQVRDGLEGQRKELDGLLDRMRRTVQEAEETEPLLAKELFDATRKADEKSIPDALKAAEQLAELGVPEEAAKASRHAGRGLDQLREGVERAARSVLGDETAALKRARGELEDLGDQVNREIARSTEPGDDPQGPRQEGGQGQPKAAQGRQGQKDQRGEPGQQGQRSGQQDRQGRAGQPGDQPDQRGRQGRGSLRGDPSDRPQQDRQAGATGGGGDRPSGLDRLLDGLNDGGPGGPIAGEGFRQWSDRMRDVEELLDDPELRSEAARIRDRVRGAREELKRHAKEPDWGQMKALVADPIRELRDRVAEEVRLRESPDSLVPIDRDPVPPEFAEGVRRYYERLGSGR